MARTSTDTYRYTLAALAQAGNPGKNAYQIYVMANRLANERAELSPSSVYQYVLKMHTSGFARRTTLVREQDTFPSTGDLALDNLWEMNHVNRQHDTTYTTEFNVYTITTSGAMRLEEEIKDAENLHSTLKDALQRYQLIQDAGNPLNPVNIPQHILNNTKTNGPSGSGSPVKAEYRLNPVTGKVVPKAFYDIMVKLGNIKDPSPDHIVDKDGNKITSTNTAP